MRYGREGTGVTYQHPHGLMIWWEDAVSFPPDGPEAMGILTSLIFGASDSPSTPASTMPQAERGDEVHVGEM